MKAIADGRYYGGTRTAHGGWVHPGDPEGIPSEGEHLFIRVESDEEIFWSLDGVGKRGCYCCTGKAKVMREGDDELILVLEEPDFRSIGSFLVAPEALKPQLARPYLAGLMKGLTRWPLKVRLPASLRDEYPLMTEYEQRHTWAHYDAVMAAGLDAWSAPVCATKGTGLG